MDDEGSRQFDRVLVVATGLALTLAGAVVLGLELLSGPARVVLGAPLVGVGVVAVWAGVARWSPEVATSGRRESPQLLLPIERLFLVPLVALSLAGLLAILRDPDLQPVMQLLLAVGTTIVLLVLTGFVVGRVGVAPKDLGRYEPRPPMPPGDRGAR